MWAIGTGRVASAADAPEVCKAIRDELGNLSSPELAAGVRVLYGGSVNAKNVGEIVGQGDVDGALVGGASLDAEQFATLSAIQTDGTDTILGGTQLTYGLTNRFFAKRKLVPGQAGHLDRRRAQRRRRCRSAYHWYSPGIRVRRPGGSLDTDCAVRRYAPPFPATRGERSRWYMRIGPGAGLCPIGSEEAGNGA